MFAEKMLGHKLITKQTGAAGRACDAVYIVEREYSRREFYFAILYDRKSQGPVLVASAQGGVDIEGVAAESPEAILTESIDINKGLDLAQAKKLAERVGFSGSTVEDAATTMVKLYKLFTEHDATLVEINPMAISNAGKGVEYFPFFCFEFPRDLSFFLSFFSSSSHLHGRKDQLR